MSVGMGSPCSAGADDPLTATCTRAPSERAYARQVLSVAVLGALEVTRDGQRVPVPVGKTSELVVRLALEAGELVRADRLVEDLWAAGGVATRRNALQSKIAMLRRALGDPARDHQPRRRLRARSRAADVDALAALERDGHRVGAVRGRRRPGRC